MAEIFLKASKEFQLNFKNLVLAIFSYQNFHVSVCFLSPVWQ